MKENSMENLQNKKYFKNIDEAIKIYEEFRRFKNNGFIENIDPDFFFNLTDIFLENYKRVLKENEKLLQEKINNQKIIVLAQNDMLNYQAGFEDGKNGRTSAVQNIIENQQYYIFQKQIEKYEEHIEKLQKENEGQKCVIETPSHNEEVCEELVDRLQKENEELNNKVIEKDNRIKQLENMNKFQSKDIKEAVDYTFELNKEIEEKDKIIQNMSKYILSLDIDKDICMKNTVNTELCNEDNSNCVECIIKHFSN